MNEIEQKVVKKLLLESFEVCGEALSVWKMKSGDPKATAQAARILLGSSEKIIASFGIIYDAYGPTQVIDEYLDKLWYFVNEMKYFIDSNIDERVGLTKTFDELKVKRDEVEDYIVTKE